MSLTPEQIAAAKRRRLKEPLEITGYEVVINKIASLDANAPRTRKEFVTRTIETIGDLAALDAHAKIGKFVPLPDLSVQALMIVIDKLGMLEPKEEVDGG